VRYQIRTPLAQVGRGATNEVRLSDESVSEMHAKLQRRDDGWYVVDMNSTNGTWVGGSRVTGERRLEGAPDVRFGGVKLRFLPAGMSDEAASAQGARPAPIADRARPMDATTDPRASISAPQAGTSRLIWMLLVLLVVAAVFFMLRGRA